MDDHIDALAPDDMPVSALVGDAVERVGPDATLAEVASVLSDREIGIVAVGEGDLPSGVVSERDVVRAIAQGVDTSSATAAELAQTELRWVDPEATVGEAAAEMMSAWVRHVLVGRDGTLVGILSARDLLGYYASIGDS